MYVVTQARAVAVPLGNGPGAALWRSPQTPTMASTKTEPRFDSTVKKLKKFTAVVPTSPFREIAPPMLRVACATIAAAMRRQARRRMTPHAVDHPGAVFMGTT
jgi:hypothetical protein